MEKPPYNRTDKIYRDLDWFVAQGILGDYTCSSPGGRKRWNVWGPPGSALMGRVYSTSEVEIFITGLWAGINGAKNSGVLERI